MNKATAFSNNDISFIAWQYEQKIPDCLGFAIYRTDLSSNKKEILPAWVGFRGQSNKNWKPQTTEIWPIQKFSWRDLTAKRDNSYEYEIAPMVGKVGNLKPAKALILKTEKVDLKPTRGSFSAYFNRGILSTQSLTHQIPSGPGGSPNYKVLLDRIDQPGDPLRNNLAGQMLEALKSLLDRAKNRGGQCYCALYELNDPELLQLLIGCDFVHIVLSNTGTDDEVNDAARQGLHESNTDVTNRMLKSGHIGHNKFVVYVDEKNNPQAVLTGSTNWTYTALCGQSNNSLIIESSDLASLYYEYWKKLKAAGDEQSPGFRTSNNEAHEIQVDGSNLELWFSPNTKLQNKPSKNPAQPLDMKEVFETICGAKKGILFLLFQPGAPSIMDQVIESERQNQDLFIRGAATDPTVAEDYYNVSLQHRSGEKPETVVAASAINDQFSFWQKELLKTSPGAHAIIHDKIVVVDPLSPNCAVITGSHNLGYQASYANDENLLIIRGHSELAKAYTVHVMDIYDHYRWRYTLQNKKSKAWSGLSTSDKWQDKYFNVPSIQKEVQFWV